jgi:hypothetical protein
MRQREAADAAGLAAPPDMLELSVLLVPVPDVPVDDVPPAVEPGLDVSAPSRWQADSEVAATSAKAAKKAVLERFI